MALSASSSCTQTVTHRLTSASTDPSWASSNPGSSPQGLVPLPAKPKFEGSGLRRTKSRKPVKAGAREAVAEVHSLESAINKVGEEIATASGEILDAVDLAIDDGPTGVRRSRTGKMNSRTSRRRALVMCLALGMVRPCASNMTNNLKESSDLRRTVSEFPIPRTSSMQMPVSGLMSQVSLATSLKQTNLLGQHEDLQKLTTLQ